MPKYVAMEEIYSLENKQYYHPGDVFEVTNDEAFQPLVDNGVLIPFGDSKEVQYSYDKEVWTPANEFVRNPDKKVFVRVVNKTVKSKQMTPKEVSDAPND